jgi:DNA invertase Pin-like site-specific DNA recombinase
MIYGYARVSTGGQSEAAQVRQLRAAGAAKVFREVASGAKTDRPQLGVTARFAQNRTLSSGQTGPGL